MAEPSDLSGEVTQALDSTEDLPVRFQTGEQAAQSARRIKALTLKLAGMTDDQIAEQLELSVKGARALITRTLQRAENRNADQMREVENQRLDRAQAAIWAKVLNGEEKAVLAFLAISKQRVLLNGLNAPTRVEVNIGIKQEMEAAFAGLDQLMEESAAILTEAQKAEAFVLKPKELE